MNKTTTAYNLLINAPQQYFDEETVGVFRSLGTVDRKNYSSAALKQCISAYDVLVIRVDTIVDKELLDAAHLKVIATATTGVNHIDMDYAKQKGVEVISLQGANTTPTAEHVFALLLCLIRKLPAAFDSLRSGKWNRADFIGTSLKGKKMGIVGFGRIGQHVGRIAQAFGMEICAFDPYVPKELFQKNHATQMELDVLLQEADVITLHMFLSDETNGMFTLEKFQLMKKNAVVINCSRGAVLVEVDLVTALQEGIIAGAALDVYCKEPLPKDHVLVAYAKNHDNLILTPHIAGSTVEAAHEAGMDVATKTKNFLCHKL